MKASSVSTKPAKFRFPWEYGERGGIIAANTKSEARAEVKRRLGIGSHGRLPIGVRFDERINNRKELT